MTCQTRRAPVSLLLGWNGGGGGAAARCRSTASLTGHHRYVATFSNHQRGRWLRRFFFSVQHRPRPSKYLSLITWNLFGTRQRMIHNKTTFPPAFPGKSCFQEIRFLGLRFSKFVFAYRLGPFVLEILSPTTQQRENHSGKGKSTLPHRQGTCLSTQIAVAAILVRRWKQR